MPEPVTISFYADQALKNQLEQAAQLEDRSVSNIIRRMLENSLDNIPPLDRAILFQVGKDNGLSSLVETASFIIRDWQRLKTALELHCPTGQPHTLAIRVPAGEAQPEEV
jgi:hypothetical protein